MTCIRRPQISYVSKSKIDNAVGQINSLGLQARLVLSAAKMRNAKIRTIEMVNAHHYRCAFHDQVFDKRGAVACQAIDGANRTSPGASSSPLVGAVPTANQPSQLRKCVRCTVFCGLGNAGQSKTTQNHKNAAAIHGYIS